MMVAMPQLRYHREDTWRMLREYQQRFALGARPPKREERLGFQRQRPDEAPWVMTAAEESDLESALKAVPFKWMQIAFMNLAVGETDWGQSPKAKDRKTGRMMPISWREKVGDWWGLTAGEVALVTAEVIEIVHARMNGYDLPPALVH